MAGEQIVFILKITFLFLSLLFFFLILVVESKMKRLKDVMAGKWDLQDAVPLIPAKNLLQKRWEGVMHKINLKRESDFKSALGEADAILEEVFKKLGFPNSDTALGQRKITTEQLSNINELFEAHKKIAKISKDSNLHIIQNEAQDLIGIYEKSLRELQVID